MDNTPITLSHIKKRVLSSFLSLTVRQIILRAISFVSLNIVLAKTLSVSTLGVFNIATAIVTFFAFFSDIGLAASLIQKKDNVTQDDIKTVFTIQQAIVGALSGIIIIAAPLIGQFYNLNDQGIWLIRILGFSFFLSSLKVVPAVLLERELKFEPLVLVEVVETIIFNSLLIFLVFQGRDIWSFSVAAVSRGVVGTTLLYILAPIRIGIGIQKEAARQLLKFGIPYQTNNLLALLKDRLVPLLVARMVGSVGIGYITWAQAIAFLPLEVMNIMIRITFPAFSRLQGDKVSLSQAIEKSLFMTALFVYPALFGLSAILPSVVAYVVSPKWQPALLSFYLFAFSTFWATLSTTFTNVLNATGYIKSTLKLMVFWTIITWVLTPILVLMYGFIGVAIASFIISFTSVVTIILVKRILSFKIFEPISMPLLASILMGVVVFIFSQIFVKNQLTLGISVLIGGLVYSVTVFLTSKDKILADLKSLRHV